jgi:effector-binding domain-containing protein
MFFSPCILRCLFPAALILFVSCGGGDHKEPVKQKEPIILKKDNPVSKNDTTPNSAPIINLTDTVARKYTVLYIKDSAITSVRLSQKLASIYGARLGEIIRKNKLKTTGAPMAWYKNQKAPFFFEAGIPVDKKPAVLPKGVFSRNIGGDSAVVAHYYGPYEEMVQAYDVLKEWLKDRKKKSTSPPYEVYVGDPIDKNGKPIDPYKVQTDIIFPHN